MRKYVFQSPNDLEDASRSLEPIGREVSLTDQHLQDGRALCTFQGVSQWSVSTQIIDVHIRPLTQEIPQSCSLHIGIIFLAVGEEWVLCLHHVKNWSPLG